MRTTSARLNQIEAAIEAKRQRERMKDGGPLVVLVWTNLSEDDPRIDGTSNMTRQQFEEYSEKPAAEGCRKGPLFIMRGAKKPLAIMMDDQPDPKAEDL